MLLQSRAARSPLASMISICCNPPAARILKALRARGSPAHKSHQVRLRLRSVVRAHLMGKRAAKK
jgi:hypothetical protein